jgi:hypothetical protein
LTAIDVSRLDEFDGFGVRSLSLRETRFGIAGAGRDAGEPRRCVDSVNRLRRASGAQADTCRDKAAPKARFSSPRQWALASSSTGW